MYFQKCIGWSVPALILAFTLTAGAADITGTWAIQDLQIANKVHLSLNVIQNGRGSVNSSSAFDISQLRGLSAAQMAAPVGTVARFEILREAGTFACEGYLKDGRGAGTFMFQPNPGVLQQMRALGFLDVNEDSLFKLALHDVGPRFADEIRSNGIAVSTASQLIAMRIHGVTGEFTRRVQEAGYRPDEEDLIKMRIHGVTTDFANEVRRMYAAASIDDLVRMRIHGVALDFAAEVRRMYASASIDDLVRLRIHGVSMDYIRNMQSRSKNITLDQLVRLKIHGID